MTDSEKVIIRKLIVLLKSMYEIISNNLNNDVSYGMKNIIKLIHYLEEELTDDTVVYKELINSVMVSYKSMFPPICGLSEFNIWDEDFEKRYKVNKDYDQIKEQIETILGFD